MNQIVLTGNLTRDVELSYTQTGKAWTKFCVATNEPIIKDGNKQEITTFHNCVMWGKPAESVAKLKSGEFVCVIGRLNNRSYESNGVKKYVTEVIAQTVTKGLEKVEKNDEQAETSNFDNFGGEEVPF